MTSARRRKSKQWSFSTGEHGRNRVRVFEDLTRGVIFAEFYEGRRRIRQSLGPVDREMAKAKAEQLAAAFRTTPHARHEPMTLRALFDNYLREVTPTKGEGKQRHDRHASALFLKCFGSERKPESLSRREWDRFVDERRRGVVRSANVKKPRVVRDRQIGYDLSFLLSVLNWATRAGDGRGGVLLERNPPQGPFASSRGKSPAADDDR